MKEKQFLYKTLISKNNNYRLNKNKEVKSNQITFSCNVKRLYGFGEFQK